jgi:hypothetical protein
MIDLIQDRQFEIVALCRRFDVKSLELFGSAAVGIWSPNESDLDFLVDFQPMTPGSHAKAYFGLWFGFQDLFGRDVDLVESKAVRNLFFVADIEKNKIVLYAA